MIKGWGERFGGGEEGRSEDIGRESMTIGVALLQRTAKEENKKWNKTD
jgi:hypothetical protein